MDYGIDITKNVERLADRERERCLAGEGSYQFDKSAKEYLSYSGGDTIIQVNGPEWADYARMLFSIDGEGNRQYLLFAKVDDGEFKAVALGDEEYIRDRITKSVEHVFNDESLLADIKEMLLDKEEWDFEDGDRALASYLHRLLSISKIKHSEGKKVFEFNRNKDKVLFNTNLLDKYGDYIKIMLRYQDNSRDGRVF